MFAYVSSMEVDEARSYVLAKYFKKKGTSVVTESDHNPLIFRFNYLWSDKIVSEKQRYEIFNYKDPEGIIKFNQLTSADTLSSCVQTSDVRGCGKRWLKAFNNILHRSFKKVRIGQKPLKKDEVHTLLTTKMQILKKISEINEIIELNPDLVESQSKVVVSLQEKIDDLDVKISDICASKNAQIIKEHYGTVTDLSGNFNIPKMWGLKRKLNMNSSDPPSAKKDQWGNLVTTKNGLLSLYKKTYIDRLSHKPIRQEYEELRGLKEKLFSLRYELSSFMKSENWEVDQIRKICKTLKNNKSRDENGFVYELFKPAHAGDDVFESLTKLFNLSKKELNIPEFFEKMSITSLYKNKGLQSDFSNQRGIFSVSKVKSIYDKLIYSEVYDVIDQNMG